jgi:arginine deiminase
VSYTHGVDSEFGTLKSVLVHRPGPELKRMTSRTRDRLLLTNLPWVGGAQQEHDRLTQALRDQGVEVLYVTELLQDALEYQAARAAAIAAVTAAVALGDELAEQVAERLGALGPEDLAQVLIAGLAAEDLPGGRGLAYQLLRRAEFIIEPLPNLVFTRDSGFWVGDRPGVASLAAPHRRREADLLALIYGHHPRFSGSKPLYGPELEPLDGGDVLLLAPGVLAVGVGQRTTAAGAERLARHALDAGLAHTVLAIPLDQPAGAGYLDTLCTVIDAGTVLMHPATAFTLTAHSITAHPAGTRVSRPQPFLEAAARALGIERLNVIDAGPDDGGNALALGPRLVVCHERSTEVIARLEAAGVAVLQVPGSELASSRGGPRCMACPIGRDPAAEGESGQGESGSGAAADRNERDLLVARRPLPAAPVTTVSPALDPELAPA